MSLALDDRLRKIASDSLRAYGPGPYLAASCQEGRPSALATQLDNLLCYRPLLPGDHRNEPHREHVPGREALSVGALLDELQLLVKITHRDDHAAAGLQLVDQLDGDLARSRGHDDGIIGRRRPVSLVAIADDDLDLLVVKDTAAVQILQGLPGLGGERRAGPPESP